MEAVPCVPTADGILKAIDSSKPPDNNILKWPKLLEKRNSKAQVSFKPLHDKLFSLTDSRFYSSVSCKMSIWRLTLQELHKMKR